MTKLPRCPHCYKIAVGYFTAHKDEALKVVTPCVAYVCPEDASIIEPEWVGVKTVENDFLYGG